jgi:hypothetical protein
MACEPKRGWYAVVGRIPSNARLGEVSEKHREGFRRTAEVANTIHKVPVLTLWQNLGIVAKDIILQLSR